MTVQDHPLLTSMTMIPSCTCRSRRGLTAQFSVQGTFSRRKSRTRVLQSSQIPRSSTKIKKPSSSFTDSGPFSSRQAAWAQDLFTPFPSEKSGQSCIVHCLQIPLNRLQGEDLIQKQPLEHSQLSRILTVLEPQLRSFLSPFFFFPKLNTVSALTAAFCIMKPFR
ncbi:hypothetical protein AXF42_Ash014541 [Apostasia shenzhenica]|uniref:Uncharacterized protein n=1 Tax=Apostasia shenzhenica TaxID=1088818 RepID=A0A2H9ZWV4_9ASPA|nr:hypothetical protein AXF42_Ash014541 [Apostasia shenzhenica]